MLRNGYAKPSFAADSADKMRRKLSGTCFVANLPPEAWSAAYMRHARCSYIPTIAAEMIGSVGVRQAAMTSDETKLIGGKTTKTIPG